MGCSTTRLPASSCPVCGNECNAATWQAGPSRKSPEPGDITVCVECVSVLKFGPEMQLQGVSNDEVRAMAAIDRAELHRVQSQVRLAKVFH